MHKAEFVRRVRDCERRLYRVARTMLTADADCEDAVQEALLKAWAALTSLREDAYFETWLIRILINECRNIHRRRPQAETSIPDELPMAAENTEGLFEAMLGLPEKQRIALELHYIEGYKTWEISRMLGVPESTVKWRLARGRRTLKNKLGEEAET